MSETSSLTDLARDLLAQATTPGSDRAARTVLGGRDRVLRHTVMALRAGAELAEHTAPGDASLQVVVGRVRLSSPSGSTEAAVGSLVAIPAERHSLTAIEDSVVLLTVVAR